MQNVALTRRDSRSSNKLTLADIVNNTTIDADDFKQNAASINEDCGIVSSSVDMISRYRKCIGFTEDRYMDEGVRHFATESLSQIIGFTEGVANPKTIADTLFKSSQVILDRTLDALDEFQDKLAHLRVDLNRFKPNLKYVIKHAKEITLTLSKEEQSCFTLTDTKMLDIAETLSSLAFAMSSLQDYELNDLIDKLSYLPINESPKEIIEKKCFNTPLKHTEIVKDRIAEDEYYSVYAHLPKGYVLKERKFPSTLSLKDKVNTLKYRVVVLEKQHRVRAVEDISMVLKESDLVKIDTSMDELYTAFTDVVNYYRVLSESLNNYHRKTLDTRVSFDTINSVEFLEIMELRASLVNYVIGRMLKPMFDLLYMSMITMRLVMTKIVLIYDELIKGDEE